MPILESAEQVEEPVGNRNHSRQLAQCRWLKPRLVVAIDFLEWTLDDRLRHASFVARSETPRKNVTR